MCITYPPYQYLYLVFRFGAVLLPQSENSYDRHRCGNALFSCPGNICLWPKIARPSRSVCACMLPPCFCILKHYTLISAAPDTVVLSSPPFCGIVKTVVVTQSFCVNILDAIMDKDISYWNSETQKCNGGILSGFVEPCKTLVSSFSRQINDLCPAVTPCLGNCEKDNDFKSGPLAMKVHVDITLCDS